MDNKELLAMLEQLKARVVDVEQIVSHASADLNGYAHKVDKLDDKLYELQLEIEQATLKPNEGDAGNVDPAEDGGPADADGSSGEQSDSSASNSEGSDASASETKIGPLTITPEMKAGMKDGAAALGEVARDSREVISELAGAMGDIKDVFSFGPKGPTRRR